MLSISREGTQQQFTELTCSQSRVGKKYPRFSRQS